MKEVLITGTGLGGLATGLRLAKKGYRVRFVEQFTQPGGRLNCLKKDGFTFDMAPSFFSMTYEFDEFARFCNIEIPFEFVPLDPLYAVNFSSTGKTYLIYKDLKKLAAEFAEIEPGFEDKMQRFLTMAGKIFHDTENLVIRRNFDSLPDFLFTLTKVPWGHAPKMFRSVWSEMERYFTSNEVKEIFSLVAFFLGATPFDTPAVYTLLSYTELVHNGYFNVRGGMYRIVEGLMNELRKENCHFDFNTKITGFESKNGQISALTDQHGKKHEADIFVINADAAVFRGEVLKNPKYTMPKLDKMNWTLAPLTIYLGVKGKIPGIHHHHYFLGQNFKEYASKIFKNSIGLEKPYYYVNTISKFNPESAPDGCESLFILVPVPDLRYKPSWDDRDQVVNNLIADLSQRVRYDIAGNLLSKTVLTPLDWEKTFGLYRGSGLGLAHNIMQIGAFRPENFDKKYKNVFYVGSSTVPGTGLPMAIISSKLVTERILKNYGTF